MGLQGHVDRGHAREPAPRSQVFYAFGEWHGFAVVEFPDTESCAECSMTLAVGGVTAAFKTTVLIAPDEAGRAIRR